MPRLLAPSSSTRSSALPSPNDLHDAQALHGSPGLFLASAAFFSQLIAFASKRAVVVLPVPRGPENRYACDTLCEANALISVRVTTFWPETSAKHCGRHLR